MFFTAHTCTDCTDMHRHVRTCTAMHRHAQPAQTAQTCTDMHTKKIIHSNIFVIIIKLLTK